MHRSFVRYGNFARNLSEVRKTAGCFSRASVGMVPNVVAQQQETTTYLQIACWSLTSIISIEVVGLLSKVVDTIENWDACHVYSSYWDQRWFFILKNPLNLDHPRLDLSYDDTPRLFSWWGSIEQWGGVEVFFVVGMSGWSDIFFLWTHWSKAEFFSFHFVNMEISSCLINLNHENLRVPRNATLAKKHGLLTGLLTTMIPEESLTKAVALGGTPRLILMSEVELLQVDEGSRNVHWHVG